MSENICIPMARSFPNILVGGDARRSLTNEDRENILYFLRFSRDNQQAIRILYRNRMGGVSSKLVVVDTLQNNSFIAQVFAEKRADDEICDTELKVKNFLVSNVLKAAVFMLPRNTN